MHVQAALLVAPSRRKVEVARLQLHDHFVEYTSGMHISSMQ